MDRVVSLIEEMRASLNRHLESRGDIEEIELFERRQGLNASCATLQWKFKMLSTCVGILSMLQRRQPVTNDNYSIQLVVEGNKSHTVRCALDLLDSENVICTFYNMLTLTVSLQDALLRLIWEVYRESLQADGVNGGSPQVRNLTLPKLRTRLAQACPLGVRVAELTAEGGGYKKIIDLRNCLVHQSLTGVLTSDPLNPHSVPQIEARWTPTGERMALPDYAGLVYKESVHLIVSICRCIVADPVRCVEPASG